MGINFKEFMNDIKKGAGIAKRKYVKGVEKATSPISTALAYGMKDAREGRANLKAVNKKALDLAMKYYPPETLTGPLMRSRRRKEFKKMIDNGDVHNALLKAKTLDKLFAKDNPKYKPIPYNER